jgi:hypothetical protein
MKPEAMVLFVFEVPEGMDSGKAAAFEQGLNAGLREPEWEGVERVRVLGLDSDRMEWLRDSFRPTAMRAATQEVLREIGEDGAKFLQRESEYQFVWDTAFFGPFGMVQVLHVIHKGEEAFAPNPPASAN